MDFDGAIKAHAEWKVKLTSYIGKPDGSYKPEIVSQDNQCPLGKWIYGEGKAYQTQPEFTELKKHHAAFHKAAGDIIRRCDKGENVSADLNLGANSEYRKVSNEVVRLIMALKSKVK